MRKPSTTLALAAATIALAAGFGSMAAQAETPVTFKDGRGQTISLPHPPERVVAIATSGPILFRAVDGTASHLAAVNKKFLDGAYHNALYDKLLPELGTIPGTAAMNGFVPNVEAILASKPDLIIQWTFDPAVIEPLERVGLTVAGWNCCTEEDRRSYLTMTGEATGKQAQAEKILKLQAASDAELRGGVGALPEGERVSALQIDQLGDQIRVIANGSLDVALSGLSNPAADGSGEWWKTVNLEQLFNWNPQIILIPAYAAALTPENFYSDPLLAEIEAVKNHRVYKIPAFAGSPDAPEIFLESPWAAAIAHGSKAAPDFRNAVLAAYHEIYGLNLSTVQVDDVLALQQNRASAGYEALFAQAAP